MIKKIVYIASFMLLMSTYLWAHDPKNQSYAPSYAEVKLESMDFKNSNQKEDAKRATLTLQHQIQKHCLKVAYEKSTTNTKQPPLLENLHVNKLYLKYTYHLNEKHFFNAGYISVEDNLVPTDGGKVYSLGYTLTLNAKSNFKIAGYYSHYDIFDAYQADVQYQNINQINGFKTSLIFEGKYIHIDACQSGFCANAKEDYFTPGIRLKAAKNGYFIHAGAFFGKRAFAIMNEGFMLQHHAMEFSQTYMAGMGKRWKNFGIKLRYITQKAQELPYNNDGVDVKNIAGILAYYF